MGLISKFKEDSRQESIDSLMAFILLVRKEMVIEDVIGMDVRALSCLVQDIELELAALKGAVGDYFEGVKENERSTTV